MSTILTHSAWPLWVYITIIAVGTLLLLSTITVMVWLCTRKWRVKKAPVPIYPTPVPLRKATVRRGRLVSTSKYLSLTGSTFGGDSFMNTGDAETGSNPSNSGSRGPLDWWRATLERSNSRLSNMSQADGHRRMFSRATPAAAPAATATVLLPAPEPAFLRQQIHRTSGESSHSLPSIINGRELAEDAKAFASMQAPSPTTITTGPSSRPINFSRGFSPLKQPPKQPPMLMDVGRLLSQIVGASPRQSNSSSKKSLYHGVPSSPLAKRTSTTSIKNGDESQQPESRPWSPHQLLPIATPPSPQLSTTPSLPSLSSSYRRGGGCGGSSIRTGSSDVTSQPSLAHLAREPYPYPYLRGPVRHLPSDPSTSPRLRLPPSAPSSTPYLPSGLSLEVLPTVPAAIAELPGSPVPDFSLSATAGVPTLPSTPIPEEPDHDNDDDDEEVVLREPSLAQFPPPRYQQNQPYQPPQPQGQQSRPLRADSRHAYVQPLPPPLPPPSPLLAPAHPAVRPRGSQRASAATTGTRQSSYWDTRRDLRPVSCASGAAAGTAKTAADGSGSVGRRKSGKKKGNVLRKKSLVRAEPAATLVGSAL